MLDIMLKCLQNPIEIITLSLCEIWFERVCSFILYYTSIMYNTIIKNGFKLTTFVKFYNVVIVEKQISSYYYIRGFCLHLNVIFLI